MARARIALVFALGTIFAARASLAEPSKKSAPELLAQIQAAQEAYDLERYYGLARSFLSGYPAHEATDGVREELALQLVAESIKQPASEKANEARALLATQARDAKSETRRFDAALVLLKFSTEKDALVLEAQADALLAAYPKLPERREVHAFLIERLLELDRIDRAAARVTRMLAEFPSAADPNYRALLVRAGLRGKPLPLSAADKKAIGVELAGKVVIVDLWATWCRPCIAAQPALRAFAKKHEQAGLVLIEASIDDHEADWARYLKAHPSPHPQLFATKTGFHDRVGVSDIPYYVVVDRQGRVVSTELRGEALFALAEKLASEKN